MRVSGDQCEYNSPKKRILGNTFNIRMNAGHDFDGEYDCVIVLCRDRAQRLKIPQLGVS